MPEGPVRRLTIQCATDRTISGDNVHVRIADSGHHLSTQQPSPSIRVHVPIQKKVVQRVLCGEIIHKKRDIASETNLTCKD